MVTEIAHASALFVHQGNDMKLTELKGIGPKTEELFERIGVHSAEELIRYYPAGYDVFLPPCSPGENDDGRKLAVEGVLSGRPSVRRHGRLVILTAQIACPEGPVRLNWYNALFLQKQLMPGTVFVFRGVFHIRKGMRVMDHPEIYTKDRYRTLEGRILPVYGLTKGLTGKTVAKAVHQALDAARSSCREYLPESMIHLLNLMDEPFALRAIHFPGSMEEFYRARKRLVFDEFFLFILSLRMLRESEGEAGRAFPLPPCWDTEELTDKLPYRLTGAQMRVWREVEADLAKDVPMSRLIQGDVGSGKTIIAFLAMLQTACAGFQSALLAPTEVLAVQHYEKLMKLKETYGLDALRPVLLTGSMKASEKKQATASCADGSANAIIGTHALIQEGVSYQSLSLVITDEQHRFGVRQRQALLNKGDTLPHTMVMSATPIPRTLAVVWYGDLSVSVIDELPSGRKKIKNAVVDSSYRPQALKFLREQMAEGRQVYVICPMIEPSEEMPLANVTEETAALKKEFPEHRISMLHGRMKPEEKNRIMNAFLKGETDLLVSTTVIEVGVDVPNATVMMIENAERFGLAQLHQLRGRVGRNSLQSYCIFMSGRKSEEVMDRLRILGKSNDGFEIAEKDLALRGPGDLLGIRQSGDAMFRLADVTRDAEELKAAGEAAAAVMADDPLLLSEEYGALREELQIYHRSNERNITL